MDFSFDIGLKSMAWMIHLYQVQITASQYTLLQKAYNNRTITK